MPVMTALNVVLDGAATPDPELKKKLDAGQVIHLAGHAMSLIRMPRGMKSGKDSVLVRIDPDGRVVIAETSMALFQAAARAFAAKTGA